MATTVRVVGWLAWPVAWLVIVVVVRTVFLSLASDGSDDFLKPPDEATRLATKVRVGLMISFDEVMPQHVYQLANDLLDYDEVRHIPDLPGERDGREELINKPVGARDFLSSFSGDMPIVFARRLVVYSLKLPDELFELRRVLVPQAFSGYRSEFWHGSRRLNIGSPKGRWRRRRPRG